MKKSKRILTATVAVATMLTVSSAYATDSTSISPDRPSSNLGKGYRVGKITPFSSTPRIENRQISGTTYLADFDIKAGYGYVRMYLKNTGSQMIHFSINQGQPGGKEKYTGKVAPGQTFNEILNSGSPLAVDTFYVNLTSGSEDMSGQLGIRISTDLNF